MGYKMNGFSGFGNKKKSPNKSLMKVAALVIGANKRRQASKDAADAAKGQGIQNTLSRKL